MILWGNTAWIYLKAQVAQQLIASVWADSISSGEPSHRPWPWADTRPVARLNHPGTGTTLYILAGAQGSSLAFGPGHMDGTVLPGHTGTSIVAGHRDTHLSFLRQAEIGDRFLLQKQDGAWIGYKLVDVSVTDSSENEAWYIDQSLDVLYLVTCYPFDAIDPGGPLRANYSS